MNFEDDEDLEMEDESEADEYSVLTEAGFSEDQADAIVAAIRACVSKDSESEGPASKPGSDALALLIGPEPKKSKK